MQGKIIKGIAGFYYVYAEREEPSGAAAEKAAPGEESREGRIYECKAKGIFRKDNKKPMVGDDVRIDIIDEEGGLGNIVELSKRRSELIRPAVANIDQAIVIFSIVKPEPNFNLLDRFLIMMKQQGLDSVICFNKQDIATGKEKDELKKSYESCGCRMLFVSAQKNEGMEELRSLLHGKTTAVAGPSGVGKSSIINRLNPQAHMETGAISRKIERGRHTTRHSEIIALGDRTYIMDTPGFTSLKLYNMEKEELTEYYSEFGIYERECRFGGCAHISEPDCGVKRALSDGKISPVRYENYKQLYQELKEQKKY